MDSKTKILTISALLCFLATPFLYIGGQSGSLGNAVLGLLIFCIGMAIPPILGLIKRGDF